MPGNWTIPSFWPQRHEACVVDNGLGRPGKEILRFPLAASGRLAVIDVEFQPGVNMRIFEPRDFEALREYAPESLALPLSEALSIADYKMRGLLDLPSLRFAMVVLSSLDSRGDGPMADHHRDLLWKAFGIPVFEQLRDWSGTVIARECEVHDGLHFDSASVTAQAVSRELIVATMPSGFSADLTTEQCDCGLETARLRNFRPVAAKFRTAAA